jgi:diadenosine tetraphosphate (Ap4A) HIT family hydrolase
MTGARQDSLPGCVFCDAQSAEGSARLENTELLGSDRFVLVPALGPLAPGHVLIVSRDHALSLAALGSSVLTEYEDLVQIVAVRYAIPRKDLLEAEHGPTNISYGGGCIGHAHVNLIPGLGSLVGLLDETLPVIPGIDKLSDLMSVNGSYVLMRAATQIRVYAGGNVPSQLIRRSICEHFGRAEWDWGIFPRLDIVAATVAMWTSR